MRDEAAMGLLSLPTGPYAGVRSSKDGARDFTRWAQREARRQAVLA